MQGECVCAGQYQICRYAGGDREDRGDHQDGESGMVRGWAGMECL